MTAFRAPLSTSVMSSQPHAPDFTLLAAMPFRDLAEFTAVETAPRCARKRAAAVLAEWGLGDLEYPVGMIISELVTNSTRATQAASPADRQSVCLWMWGDPAGVYVLAQDDVPRAPVPREAGDIDDMDESGRGLAMVVPKFCAECGWYPVQDGKVTWALIRIPMPSHTPAPLSK